MKTVNVNYGGFSTEQQVDENIYNAIYQKGRADAEKELAKLPNQYSERLWENAYRKGREDAIDEYAEWLEERFASVHLFPDQRAELYVDVLKKAERLKEEKNDRK